MNLNRYQVRRLSERTSGLDVVLGKHKTRSEYLQTEKSVGLIAGLVIMIHILTDKGLGFLGTLYKTKETVIHSKFYVNKQEIRLSTQCRTEYGHLRILEVTL